MKQVTIETVRERIEWLEEGRRELEIMRIKPSIRAEFELACLRKLLPFLEQQDVIEFDSLFPAEQQVPEVDTTAQQVQALAGCDCDHEWQPYLGVDGMGLICKRCRKLIEVSQK